MSATDTHPLAASAHVAEARRSMEVCNACRYCESYCAVFPAMAMRRDFSAGDLTHLANLCHGCKGCYHACQYAPPHPFGINLPATFAEIRQESYAAYAWPAAAGRLFERNGTVVAVAMAVFVTLLLVAVAAIKDPAMLYAPQTGPGAFYRIIPLWLMNLLAGGSFLYALLALTMGGIAYWRATGAGGVPISAPPALDAAHDIFTLKNLGGGGHGCNDLDDSFAMLRRRLHHAVFYGFLLCFASTTSGFLAHTFLGWHAPYGLFSVTVLLGTLGGLLLMGGAAGLAWVKTATDPVPVARRLMGGEYALLAILFLIAASGLLLLAVRHTGAMGLLLAFHLGLVLAFFITLPYSKMVHGLYRGLALLRNAIEKRRGKVVG
jgi:citrate/tricarballylate utilization protein